MKIWKVGVRGLGLVIGSAISVLMVQLLWYPGEQQLTIVGVANSLQISYHFHRLLLVGRAFYHWIQIVTHGPPALSALSLLCYMDWGVKYYPSYDSFDEPCLRQVSNPWNYDLIVHKLIQANLSNCSVGNDKYSKKCIDSVMYSVMWQLYSLIWRLSITIWKNWTINKKTSWHDLAYSVLVPQLCA